MIELFDITRKGYASDISSVVEELTGRKPISFSQFVKDYAQALDEAVRYLRRINTKPALFYAMMVTVHRND